MVIYLINDKYLIEKKNSRKNKKLTLTFIVEKVSDFIVIYIRRVLV